MSINSRFAVAVHVLALLQQREGEPATSEWIAGSVNTNPAVVRRLLCRLADAGLTTSRLGAGGGAMLARPAAEITLRDVYLAVQDTELFGMHREPPNPECPVGRHIQRVLEESMTAAESALQETLARETIADVMGDVTRRERKRGHAIASRP